MQLPSQAVFEVPSAGRTDTDASLGARLFPERTQARRDLLFANLVDTVALMDCLWDMCEEYGFHCAAEDLEHIVRAAVRAAARSPGSLTQLTSEHVTEQAAKRLPWAQLERFCAALLNNGEPGHAENLLAAPIWWLIARPQLLPNQGTARSQLGTAWRRRLAGMPAFVAACGVVRDATRDALHRFQDRRIEPSEIDAFMRICVEQFNARLRSIEGSDPLSVDQALSQQLHLMAARAVHAKPADYAMCLDEVIRGSAAVRFEHSSLCLLRPRIIERVVSKFPERWRGLAGASLSSLGTRTMQSQALQGGPKSTTLRGYRSQLLKHVSTPAFARELKTLAGDFGLPHEDFLAVLEGKRLCRECATQAWCA